MLLTNTTTRPRQEARTDAEILAILDGRGEYTDSGQVITTDRALQQATVWACVRIVSEVIAQLPIMIQQQDRATGQWNDVREHRVLQLLQYPNGWQTGHELIAYLVLWAELRGNGYYRKSKDNRGAIHQLIPMEADDVTVRLKSDFSLMYEVKAGKIQGTFDQSEVLHYRNAGSDGYLGLSTITLMRNTIGLALSTEQHGNKLFKNGAQPGLMITAPSATKEQIDDLRQKIDEQYAGSRKAHRTMILRGDMKAEKLSMTNNDAQFLETRHYSKQEIAAAFGVPLFVLNDTQKSTTWGTGLEQQLRAFKTLSLAPRLNRLSQTLARELLTGAERRRSRFVFDTDGLTLGDFRDRMDGYRAGIDSGVLNPNEAREIEGRNPREGGDDYRKPLNIGIEGEEVQGNADTTI